jgi:hypothetical protein
LLSEQRHHALIVQAQHLHINPLFGFLPLRDSHESISYLLLRFSLYHSSNALFLDLLDSGYPPRSTLGIQASAALAYVFARSLHLIHILFPMARRLKVFWWSLSKASAFKRFYISYLFYYLLSVLVVILPLPIYLKQKHCKKKPFNLLVFPLPLSVLMLLPSYIFWRLFDQLRYALDMHVVPRCRSAYMHIQYSTLGPREQGPSTPRPASRSNLKNSALTSTSAHHVRPTSLSEYYRLQLLARRRQLCPLDLKAPLLSENKKSTISYIFTLDGKGTVVQAT